MATLSSAPPVVSPQATVPVMEVVPRGGGPGQVALAPSSPIAAMEPKSAAQLRGGGSGQVAPAPSSPVTPRVAHPLWCRRVPLARGPGWVGSTGRRPTHFPPRHACAAVPRFVADVGGAVEFPAAACGCSCFFDGCNPAGCWG